MKKANGQLAPGEVYIKATQATGTPPVTSAITAMKEDQALISLTRPVASLTKTGGFCSNLIRRPFDVG